MIKGSGLKFHPLYWSFHDQWIYFTNIFMSHWYHHWGHLHFFLLGYDFSKANRDAFSGQQRFQFTATDLWGPRSLDPNQARQYTVIGTPKWYFKVTELWRRVFVQPWDTVTDTGRRVGVKWDASPRDKVKGPFREGRLPDGQTFYAPYWLAGARSLPIEYFRDASNSQANRENYVADRAQALLGDDYVDETYNLQHGASLEHTEPPHPAAKPPFSDALYIHPIIEYQAVTQLDWETLPWRPADVADIKDATNTYGDGWKVEVTVPFKDPATGIYRSPFTTVPNTVLPFGQYNELVLPGSRKLVPLDKRLKHREASYAPENPEGPLDLPEEKSQQILTEWHNPWGEAGSGGRIVQQCLGGVVQARAKVILEHKMGGRRQVTVESTQYLPTTDFSGSDQDQPA
jgi:hypothetical protein